MGLIWVYEKGKPPDQRATKVQCRVNGYFGSVRPNGSLDESLEPKLADLENECNDVLFCAKSDLFDWSSTANRNRLAFYAALLFCRATQKRNLTVRSWEKSHQDLSDLMLDTQYLEDMADHYSRETQQSISPAHIRAGLLSVAMRTNTSRVAKNLFLDKLLAHAHLIKDELLSRKWQVWKSPPDADFITSDNPVITWKPDRRDMWTIGCGFRVEGAVTALPLCPSRCLVMGINGSEYRTLQTDDVVKLNTAVIRLSDRYVYSQNLSAQVETIVNECGGEEQYGVKAFTRPPVNTPTLADFMKRRIASHQTLR